MQQVPIQKIYWESFLFVLKQSSEQLARDISESLGQPAPPLLKAIRENTMNAYIFDESANAEIDIETMRCKHFVPYSNSSSVYVACRNPILWSSTPGVLNTRCVEHAHSPSIKLDTMCEGRIITIPSSEEEYILQGSNVYTKDMKIIGHYNQSTNKFYRFK
jgi:hypothetical protein